MDELPDNKEATRAFLHAVDEQVTFYNSSISNVTRIATTNTVVNLAAKIGAVGLLLRANAINGFVTTGLCTITAKVSLFKQTVDIARKRNVYTSTHTSHVMNEYAGESEVMNNYGGNHFAETNYAGSAAAVSRFRSNCTRVNIFHGVRKYHETAAYFDYSYFDSVDTTGFGQQYTPEAETNYFLKPGLTPDDRPETWYEFPSQQQLRDLLGQEQQEFNTHSREYQAARTMTDSLRGNNAHLIGRRMMNASIPIPGHVNQLKHIRPLADLPESIESAAPVGASVKFILSRGARQTFEFHPTWLRNYYFGDTTSFHWGHKSEIHIGKKCTTAYEQYMLVTGKSLQHFSHKLDAAVIQYEGGLQFNQIDVPDGNAAPVLQQQIAIIADPDGDKAIIIRSKEIEISNIINLPGWEVQNPNLVHLQSKISIKDNLLGIRSEATIRLRAPKVEQNGDEMNAIFKNSINLESNTIQLKANGIVKFQGTQYIYV